jgi:hypothetical protein
MTAIEWFCFFIAVFGVTCGWVGLGSKEKTDRENRRLREALLIEHNRAEYFRKKAEHNAFFDFEKVNKKEK